jgi:hypothetical protein
MPQGLLNCAAVPTASVYPCVLPARVATVSLLGVLVLLLVPAVRCSVLMRWFFFFFVVAQCKVMSMTLGVEGWTVRTCDVKAKG